MDLAWELITQAAPLLINSNLLVSSLAPVFPDCLLPYQPPCKFLCLYLHASCLHVSALLIDPLPVVSSWDPWCITPITFFLSSGLHSSTSTLFFLLTWAPSNRFLYLQVGWYGRESHTNMNYQRTCLHHRLALQDLGNQFIFLGSATCPAPKVVLSNTYYSSLSLSECLCFPVIEIRGGGKDLLPQFCTLILTMSVSAPQLPFLQSWRMFSGSRATSLLAC